MAAAAQALRNASIKASKRCVGEAAALRFISGSARHAAARQGERSEPLNTCPRRSSHTRGNSGPRGKGRAKRWNREAKYHQAHDKALSPCLAASRAGRDGQARVKRPANGSRRGTRVLWVVVVGSRRWHGPAFPSPWNRKPTMPRPSAMGPVNGAAAVAFWGDRREPVDSSRALPAASAKALGTQTQRACTSSR